MKSKDVGPLVQGQETAFPIFLWSLSLRGGGFYWLFNVMFPQHGAALGVNAPHARAWPPRGREVSVFAGPGQGSWGLHRPTGLLLQNTNSTI